MAWRPRGDKQSSEPMMVKSLTQICVTRFQWVKVRGDGRWSSSGAREDRNTNWWPACDRHMAWTQTVTIDDRWAKMGKPYIDGLMWTGIETHTTTLAKWIVTVFRGMILTFIVLWMVWYTCDSTLQQFEFSAWLLSIRGLNFHFWGEIFSDVNANAFAGIFHALGVARRSILLTAVQCACNQITKIVGCACAGNARDVFPAIDLKGNH